MISISIINETDMIDITDINHNIVYHDLNYTLFISLLQNRSYTIVLHTTHCCTNPATKIMNHTNETD